MTNDQIEELARAMALSDGYDPDETWQEFDRCAALSMDYSGAPLDPDWENKVFPTFTRWAEYVPKTEALAPIIDRWISEARERWWRDGIEEAADMADRWNVGIGEAIRNMKGSAHD